MPIEYSLMGPYPWALKGNQLMHFPVKWICKGELARLHPRRRANQVRLVWGLRGKF